MNSERIFAFCIASGGVFMDLCYGKVWNGWIGLSWILGLCCQLWNRGPKGIPVFAAGAALPIAVLYLLFQFRMLGAGDIKLLSALGGIMGAGGVWKCILCSFLLGAVISAWILVVCGNLKERILYFLHYLLNYRRTGSRVPYIRRGERMENFHFTVPILLAVMLYMGGFY